MIATLKKILTWIAGTLTALTAVLYGFGFFALRAHLNLLGISGWIDVETQDYLTVGGQVLATLPIFLAIGLLITSLLAGLGLFATKKKWLARNAVLWTVTTLGFLLIVVWGLALLPPAGLLMTEPGTLPDTSWGHWILRGEDGRRSALVAYSIWAVAAVATIGFAIECCRWIIQNTVLSVVRIALVLLGCVYALSLPINYGILVIPIKMPEAHLQTEGQTTLSGWLLNRDLSDPEKPIALLVREGGKERILLINRDAAKKIEILGTRFVFPR